MRHHAIVSTTRSMPAHRILRWALKCRPALQDLELRELVHRVLDVEVPTCNGTKLLCIVLYNLWLLAFELSKAKHQTVQARFDAHSVGI